MRRSFLAAAMTRVSRPVSSVSWKVTIPFALMLGLVGLIGAASAQDAGGAIGRITVNIAPPLWLILQIWLARQAGIDRPYGASANVVARVLALAGVFAPAFPTNVVIAIVVLVIFGGLGLIIFLLVQTVRKSRRAAFWILPLVGSVLLFMGFAAWRNSPSVAQAYSGVGLVIGCVAYLIASRIGTSPSQAPP